VDFNKKYFTSQFNLCKLKLDHSNGCVTKIKTAVPYLKKNCIDNIEIKLLNYFKYYYY